MKITIANKAGFCFGVKRAMKIAYKELEKASGKPVYTLGPLVHNPQVIDQLEKDGIKSIEQEDLENHNVGHLIIRTHGISPSIRRKAVKLGFKNIDSTCPLVKKIHKIVRTLRDEDYKILVIGHASHPEVVGIVGQVEGDCTVIENIKDSAELPRFKKLGVVVQTTALWPKFQEIAAELVGKAQECRIFNTICHATIERQKAALKLAKNVDVMVIIGGKNSSNTRRLLEICKSVNSNSHHVEHVEDLDPSWFKGAKEAGITAGASTPDHIIKRIIHRIKELHKWGA